MRRALSTLYKHRHFVIVATLLTLVLTFPTVLYVLRTDVFWLPTGDSLDVYSNFWDIWYGQQLLTTQARSILYALDILSRGRVADTSAPIPSAGYCDKCVACLISDIECLQPNLLADHLFFGSLRIHIPSVVVQRQVDRTVWGSRVWLQPARDRTSKPCCHCLCRDCTPDYLLFHRGIKENRLALIVASGLLTGLTTITSMYAYICILMMLGFMIFAFALARWRDRRYWSHIALLVLVIAVSSLWRVYPLMSDSQSLSAATGMAR